MERNSEKYISPRAILRDRLLRGDETLCNFLVKVNDLDKSPKERNNASKDILLLIDEDVASKFKDSDFKENYYDTLSFAYFRQAQILSNKGIEALADFKIAYEAALKGTKDNPDWLGYIQATIAYLNGDIDELTRLKDEVEYNKHILIQFIQGLKKRGEPDYKNDYIDAFSPKINLL